MEADWSVEIGPGLPVIDVAWDGLVDLRSSPEKINAIEEARRHPAMRRALLALNGASSPLFTTKCDCWVLSGAEIDPDEFAASPEKARAGFASYLDVLDQDSGRFASFELHEKWARGITSALRALDLPQGRVDLVIRAAIRKDQSGFGLTIYAAGCGADPNLAMDAWERILASTVAATISAARASSSIG